ncbi:YceK/YidQ family lipoprotein [Shewanella submarina]|uniref:YceK/YidQ family lipoprotein n=1 Tax=Shewanella submarina TaxID=2016376 RepID=A0ABV7GE88_9GAMM|nr:YceK/YidQ family lipoprotein [Shewanella submarina]MCL1038241.1 YceK/YidQ family lipoprotein [Shewanella submarina]
MKNCAILSALLISTFGCTTIDTVTDDKIENKVYSGTAKHIDLGCGHGVCIDAPFSFVLDTILLPATIPVTLYKVSKSDEEVQRENYVERQE